MERMMVYSVKCCSAKSYTALLNKPKLFWNNKERTVLEQISQ